MKNKPRVGGRVWTAWSLSWGQACDLCRVLSRSHSSHTHSTMKMTLSTPPFPWALAENRTCKCCLSKQVGGLIVKQWHCFCPLAGLCIRCTNDITVKSGGAASFSLLPAYGSPPPPSPVCAPPFSTLNSQGCWNITDFIQHPPTREPTLHLVIHLVPFTFCLITLCWRCGFLFFLSFFSSSESH